MTEKHSTRLIPDHFTGCLIAGAIGDALGASIEFMTLDQILDPCISMRVFV